MTTARSGVLDPKWSPFAEVKDATPPQFDRPERFSGSNLTLAQAITDIKLKMDDSVEEIKLRERPNINSDSHPANSNSRKTVKHRQPNPCPFSLKNKT